MAAFFATAGLALSTLAAGSPAREFDTGVPRVLIDTRLQERPVTLLGLETDNVTYADAGGMIRTEPIAGFVALAPPPGAPMPTAPSPAVWLVDGQRFAGAVRAGESDPDRILWKHPALGGLAIVIDDAARIVLRRPKRGAPAPATDTRDAVTLVNGDRLEGFLESFGPTIRIEVEGRPTEVSARRVAQVALANPPRQPFGLTAWLGDGSVIRASSIRTGSAGEVILTPAVAEWTTEAEDEGPVPLSLADVVAVAFDASRLVPLAALEPIAQKATGERRWTEPIERRGIETAVFGAADIALPGPMSVEWLLPEGASRLAGDIELTPDLWAWGDCEFVVTLITPKGETELRRERVSAERPRFPVNVPIDEPRARLRLTLEPGRYGSIQDRLIFRRPLILVEPKPG